MIFAFPNLSTITTSPDLFEQLDEEVVVVTRISEANDEMEFDEEESDEMEFDKEKSDEELSDAARRTDLRNFDGEIEFCCLLVQSFVTVLVLGLPDLALLKC